jgi:hypothetical protein
MPLKTKTTALLLTFLFLAYFAGDTQSMAASANPDLSKGRQADPCFNLDFSLTPSGDKSFIIAAGTRDRQARISFSRKLGIQALAMAKGWKKKTRYADFPAGPGRSYKFRLKIRSGRNSFLALEHKGRELLRIPIPALDAQTRLAFAGGGRAKVTLYQKIDRSSTVLFSDNFTRRLARLESWTPDRKNLWRINADPNPATSASPFALESLPAKNATYVTGGHKFWDDYLMRAAVNVMGSPGQAGIISNQSKSGGYLFSISAGGTGSSATGCARLIRLLADGSREILFSRPVRLSPDCWYTLELATSGNCLRAWIDGRHLATIENRGDLTGGQFGLWSSGGSRVRFDDVEVRPLDLLPAELKNGGRQLQLTMRHWYLPPPSLPEYFKHDNSMRSWAQISDDYRFVNPGTYWHRANLSGSQEIAWHRPGWPLKSGYLSLALCADGKTLQSGYSCRIDFDVPGKGRTRILIFQRKKLLSEKMLRLGSAGLENVAFSREAGVLVVRTGGKVISIIPDTLKLKNGLAAAASSGGWRIKTNHLRTASANLFDEVFHVAPTAWRAVTGSWDVSSRWKCDPEYTWLLGRQRKGIARIDLKRPVRGDFKLDIHFALSMSERSAPFYDFPTNLTVALSQNPEKPNDGYLMRYGGIDIPSSILRLGKKVASSRRLIKENARDYGVGAGIHSDWFHVRIIRRGNTISFYSEDDLLGRFKDPKPLSAARFLSLWTRNGNGIVLARFRLEAVAPLASPHLVFGQPATGKNIIAADSEFLLPPFENFANRDKTSGARLETMPTVNPDKDPKKETPTAVLRLTNINAGGSFAAAWAPAGGIDLSRNRRLRFSWRASRQSRVNLYMLKNGTFYRARLCGPAVITGGRNRLQDLGKPPTAYDVNKVQEWSIFDCDLKAALLQANPEITDFRIDEIRLGNYEYEDTALLEGASGNPAGSWFEICEWRFGPGYPERRVTFGIKLPGCKVISGSQLPYWPDPLSMQLLTSEGTKITSFEARALAINPLSSEIIYSPRISGIALPSGKSKLLLKYLTRNPAGRQTSAKHLSHEITAAYRPEADSTPPTTPRLLSPLPLQISDFEAAGSQWQPFGGRDGAATTLVRKPGGDDYYQQAENIKCGGNLGLTARFGPLDVKRYPTISFDYRLRPKTRINLLFFLGRLRSEIFLSDSNSGADTLGKIVSTPASGNWRRGHADLRQALSRRNRTILKHLWFSDLGQGSSTTSSGFSIDNWYILPVLDASRPFNFKWTAKDESGIAGYSAVLDTSPGTVPRARNTHPRGQLLSKSRLKSDRLYLHVRALDKAGNWGPPAHWCFRTEKLTDRQPPRISDLTPKPGSRACPEFLEFTITDKGAGISPHDISLEINNLKLAPGDFGVSYLPKSGRLTVRLTDDAGRAFLKPGTVKCLLRARDYAGNRMKDYSWQWTWDPRLDRQPPGLPRIIYLPSDRLIFQDFESGQGDFQNWRRGVSYSMSSRLASNVCAGRWYLALGGRRLYDNHNETHLFGKTFDPKRFNYMAFDYRMRPYTSFDIMMQINNRLLVFPFSKERTHWKHPAFRLTRAISDNKWHRIEIDLGKISANFPKGPDGRPANIQRILTTSGTQDGASIDNFVIGSRFGTSPTFKWGLKPPSSGIGGYAWSLNSRATSIPRKKLMGSGRETSFKNLKPGSYYFHLRAQSGAGIWGPAAHYAFTIQKP